MSYYNDWETTKGISSVRECGSWRKLCMRMRRVKRRKGEPFGKQFEGVQLEKGKGCKEDVWRDGRWEEKFFCLSVLCIYMTLLAAQKRIRTARLSTLIAYSF